MTRFSGSGRLRCTNQDAGLYVSRPGSRNVSFFSSADQLGCTTQVVWHYEPRPGPGSVSFQPCFYHVVVLGAANHLVKLGAANNSHNTHACPSPRACAFFVIGAMFRHHLLPIFTLGAFMITITCFAVRCAPWFMAELPKVAWFLCEIFWLFLFFLPFFLACTLLSCFIYFPGQPLFNLLQFLFNLLEYVPLRYVWLTASLGVVGYQWFRNKWTRQRYVCVLIAYIANTVAIYLSASGGMFCVPRTFHYVVILSLYGLSSCVAGVLAWSCVILLLLLIFSSVYNDTITQAIRYTQPLLSGFTACLAVTCSIVFSTWILLHTVLIAPALLFVCLGTTALCLVIYKFLNKLVLPSDTITQAFRHIKHLLSISTACLAVTCSIVFSTWILLQIVFQASTLLFFGLETTALCVVIYKYPYHMRIIALNRICYYGVAHKLKRHSKFIQTILACFAGTCMLTLLFILVLAIPLWHTLCLAALCTIIYEWKCWRTRQISAAIAKMHASLSHKQRIHQLKVPAAATVAETQAPLSHAHRIHQLKVQSEIHEAQAVINELEQHVLELKKDKSYFHDEEVYVLKTFISVLLSCMLGSLWFGLPTHQVYPACVQVLM